MPHVSDRQAIAAQATQQVIVEAAAHLFIDCVLRAATGRG